MKSILILLIIFMSKVVLANSIVHISGNPDMKVYYEFTDTNGDYLYPIHTSSSGTPSQSTGPSQPPVGYSQYGYLETSTGNAHYLGDKAVLTFESANSFYKSSTPKSLEFYYHMYGENIGKIEIQKKRCFASGGCYWDTTWSLSGQQQTSSSSAWKKAVVPVSYDYGLHMLRMKITANGGWKGDIALSGIKVIKRPPPQVSCDASSGTLIETIYNEDGSKHFTIFTAEKANFQSGQEGSMNVYYSLGYEIEKDYIYCKDGVLGTRLDEGDGEFVSYPACWKRGTGYIDCP